MPRAGATPTRHAAVVHISSRFAFPRSRSGAAIDWFEFGKAADPKKID